MKNTTLILFAFISLISCKQKITESPKPSCSINKHFLYNTSECDCPTDGKWTKLNDNCINVEGKRYYAEFDTSLFEYDGMAIEISDYNIEEGLVDVSVDFFDKSFDYHVNHQEFFGPIGNFNDENYLIKKGGDSLINYISINSSDRINGLGFKKVQGQSIYTHLYGQFIENNQKFRAHFKFDDGKTGKFIDSVTVIFHK